MSTTLLLSNFHPAATSEMADYEKYILKFVFYFNFYRDTCTITHICTREAGEKGEEFRKICPFLELWQFKTFTCSSHENAEASPLTSASDLSSWPNLTDLEVASLKRYNSRPEAFFWWNFMVLAHLLSCIIPVTWQSYSALKTFTFVMTLEQQKDRIEKELLLFCSRPRWYLCG